MGVIQEGPGPGMQDRQAAQPAPEVAGIQGERLQGRGGTLHQEPVDGLRVGARQRAQGLGEGEGQEEVGAGEQAGPLGGEPAGGLVAGTLRTMAVAAGVIRVDRVPALIAPMDMASQGRRAAGFEIPQGPTLAGPQGLAEARAVRRPVEADDVGHLQHADLGPGLRGLA